MLEWTLRKLLKRADQLETRRRQLNGESLPAPAVDEWMRSGYMLQQTGQLDEAEALYRKILFTQPTHADALFMLSEIKQQQGQFDQATELCRKAIGANDGVAVFHASLAGLYNRAGALEKAEASYREAVQLEPGNPEYLNNLGSALLDQQRAEEALECFQQALQLNADLPQALYNIGMIHRKRGELAKAVDHIERALALHPNHKEGLLVLGDLYLVTGEPDKALKSFGLALSDEPPDSSKIKLYTPQLVVAHLGCGNELLEKDQATDAIGHFLQAIELDKTQYAAWVNLANAYREVGRLEDAITCQIEAIEQNPSCAQAFSNLAIALDDLGSCERAKGYIAEIRNHVSNLSWHATEDDLFCEQGIALALVNHALSIEPSEPDFFINKGVILEQMGRYPEALSAIEEAIKLNPEMMQAHANKGIMLLRMGQMKEGWEEYDCRIRMKSWAMNHHRVASAPLWQGERLTGKTLLVHAEQGLGDTIQFIRYYRQAAARCEHIIVECQPAVKRLLQSMPGMANVYSAGEPLPKFDFQIPLMSLPRIFYTRIENMPTDIPYIFPQPELAQSWGKAVSAADGLKVGLVWAGNKEHKGNRFRSISLDTLAPLADVPGVNFFSLQKGEAAVEAKTPPQGMRLFDYSERLADFVDTAALISNLDLVIAVDTSVAHLAGALGKPVWVLIPFCSDWRWLLDKDDSPWYPSMRLFRQPRIGDWRQCIARIREELRQLSGAEWEAS